MAEIARPRDLGRYLESREPHFVDLLRHMVNVNSFTSNRQGVGALGDLTAVPFEELGFTAERQASADPEFGKHLFLTRPAVTGPEAPSILLVSHLDTVFSPEEEREHDFRWREVGDRLYGPGTADAKGGTVVALMALEVLRELRPRVFDAVRWVVALNAAEERSAKDFGPLCLERVGRDSTPACLVFEGGGVDESHCKLVVCRKGMAIFDVSVSGRGAHAGSRHPHGANAVVQLAELIVEVAGWTDYDQELTFNVGPARGGTVVNRVPSRASARIELRAFDPEVFHEAVGRVLGLAELSTVASPEDGFACRVDVKKLLQTEPWPRDQRTDGLLEIWRRAAAELGREVIEERRGGLSDANHLWRALPTLDALGPSGAHAHCSERTEDGSKDQEYALRSSFVPKAELTARAITRLIDSHGRS